MSIESDIDEEMKRRKFPSPDDQDPQSAMAENGIRAVGDYLSDKETSDSIEPDYNSPVDLIAWAAGSKLGSALARDAGKIVGNQTGSVMGKLPMDQASRMARAKELGFDTSKTWYHGTNVKLDRFNINSPRKNTHEQPGALFFSNNPKVANQYAESSHNFPVIDHSVEVNSSEQVYPVYTNVKNPMVIDMDGDTLVGEIYTFMPIAKKRGHDSLIFENVVDAPLIEKYGIDESTGDVLVIFDPKNIRSKFAEFDPAHAHSDKLSFAQGGEVPEPNRGPASDSIEDQIDAEMAQQQQSQIPAKEDPIAAAIDHEIALSEANTVPQQILTGVEGAAQGALGPVATAAERALHELGVPGLSPEEQEARKEANPWISGLSEFAAFPFGAQAKVLGAVGKAVQAAPQIAAFGKIGSKAIAGAIDLSLFHSGSELSKLINGDPEQSVGTAIANTGLMGAIGGALGGGAGLISAKWKATQGSVIRKTLSKIADHFGGIEGVEATPMEKVLEKAEVEFPSTVMGGLSDDPAVSDLFLFLNQTDNRFGHEVQKDFKQAQEQVAKIFAESLGRSVESIPEKFDAYSAGKAIGKAAEHEAESIIGPSSKQYEAIKEEFGSIPLVPDKWTEVQVPETIDNPYRRAEFKKVKTPGVISIATDSLNKLAQSEGWRDVHSSESYKLFQKVLLELPNLKTLNSLGNLIKSDLLAHEKNAPNGILNRTKGLIIQTLTEAEGYALELEAFERLPKNQQTELFAKANSKVERLREARENFAKAAKTLYPLMDRLGLEGSISGFPKRLRAMAHDDGEGILKKLSGKNDARLLEDLTRDFPETALALREAHVEELLTKATFDGELSPFRVAKGLKDLSPQMRALLVSPENIEKINALTEILEKFKSGPLRKHNFSNTGRTVAQSALMKFLPASLSAWAFGHDPATKLLYGYLGHRIFNEGPDAVKLAMLKWLGSNKPIDPGAFKGMLEFIAQTARGENLIKESSKAAFNAGSKIIPEHLIPKQEELNRLSQKVDELELNPHALEKSSGSTAYYLPNQSIAITATAANAVKYLNMIKPRAHKLSPLDPEIPPTPQQMAEYNRVLKIAQQPLMVMDFLREGTLTTQDVAHLKALYPGFYTRLNHQILDDLTEFLGGGGKVPYTSRFALSMLLGQPLDSALRPENVRANQAVFMKNHAQEAQKNQVQKPNQSGLNKMKSANRLTLNPSDSGN